MAEYIEREAVIERLTGLFQLQAETAKAIVEAIPAADVVERKKGRWKQVHVGGYTPGGNCLSLCPECGWEFGTHRIYPDYNFCPNCGCRMDGDDDV